VKTIRLHYPAATMPVSVTGKECALSCRHCGGHYLSSMKSLADGEALLGGSAGAVKSLLVSGGCDKSGSVPLREHFPLLERLKKAGIRLNLHTGIPGPADIPRIAALADTISFDFVTDDATLREVYGHGRTGEDCLQAYRQMAPLARVVPHVTVGLKGGELSGEAEALERLRDEGCREVVFLVFVPTRGTAYQGCKPPPLRDVEELFRHARRLMPDASFSLGCMHPRGSYKEGLERICLGLGFDSFVNPSPGLRQALEAEGFPITISKECCALDPSVGWHG